MKRLFFLLSMLVVMLLPMSVFGQQNQPQSQAAGRQAFDSFLHEKCDAVVHELGLAPKDSARFIVIYHELQAEKAKLYQKYGGGRMVRLQLESGKTVADTTLIRVAHNYAQLQVEDAQLEQRFMARFMAVLTPLQLFKLQQAEQKFKTSVVRRGKPTKN